MLYRCENISNKLQASGIRAAAIGLVVLSGILLAGCDSNAPEEEDCWTPFSTFQECITTRFYHLMPAWSPDGTQIAYLRPGPMGLYIYDLETATERLVLNNASEMSSQAWSPDGEWITFGYFGAIYKVRPDGTDLTQLTFGRERFRPAWSHDGEWIAYDDATVSADQQGIWIMRPDGSDNQWLPHIRGGNPTWYPNNDRILTKGGTLPTFEYRLFSNPLTEGLPGDTLNPYPYPFYTGDYYYSMDTAVYAPNSNHIAYDLSTRDHGHNVWRMNSNGTGIQRLTQMGGSMPAWSPDGQTIAYVNIYWREAVIWLMDADGSNKRRMGPVAPPVDSLYVPIITR